MRIISEYTQGYDRGWSEGFAAGKAYGRRSAGQPSLAENQCLGGDSAPVPGSVKRFCTGHPGRGVCFVCGTEFRLTGKGMVRRHKRKRS